MIFENLGKEIEDKKTIFKLFKKIDSFKGYDFKNEINKIRNEIVELSQKRWLNCNNFNNKEVIPEEIHGHPVLRINDDSGYFYIHILEEEIFQDKNWIKHCDGCQKPLFKGDKIGVSHGWNLEWKGCQECSARNGVISSVVD
jgi:hypothetical protein